MRSISLSSLSSLLAVERRQEGQAEGNWFSFPLKLKFFPIITFFWSLDSKSATQHLNKIKTTEPMAGNLMESLLETDHLSKSFSHSKHNISSWGNLSGKGQMALNFYDSGDLSYQGQVLYITNAFKSQLCFPLRLLCLKGDWGKFKFHFFCFSIVLVFWICHVDRHIFINRGYKIVLGLKKNYYPCLVMEDFGEL